MIAQIETDIVERLNDSIPADVIAIEMPEKEADFQKPFAFGRVCVQYKGSEYGSADLRSTGEIAQDETLILELVIQSRSLRDESKGIYAIYEYVLRRLIGFQPTDCNKIFVIKFSFEEYKDGLWSYVAHLGTKRVLVQADEDVNEPLLKEVTTNVNSVSEL